MSRLLLAVLLLGITSSASAQSDVTISPEAQYILVQKNLGIQRWAIVRDQETKTVTGNIFNPEGNGSQFVWCSYLGDELYDCVGATNCSAAPCPWTSIAQVKIPESFFAVRDGRPTPVPTSQPTPRPTPMPTAPPATGLQGLLGTWDLTFKILSTFTFEYRLQRTQKSSAGYPVIVGRNELDDVIVVGRVQDIDPGNSLPYEYALVEQTVGVCYLYVFDQTGADRVAGLESNAFQLSNGDCGPLLGTTSMAGVRVSRLASADRVVESVKHAVKRHAKALRAEMRAEKASAPDGANGLFRKLLESRQN